MKRLYHKVPIISDWIAYVPTGGWNTNTTYTAQWRRVGDTMEVRFNVATSGAPNAASETVTLPTGYSIDTSKIPTFGTDAVLGKIIVNDSSSTLYPGYVLYNTTTSVRLQFFKITAAPDNVQTSPVNATNPFTFGAGDFVNGEFKVPIAGFSAGRRGR